MSYDLAALVRDIESTPGLSCVALPRDEWTEIRDSIIGSCIYNTVGKCELSERGLFLLGVPIKMLSVEGSFRPEILKWGFV